MSAGFFALVFLVVVGAIAIAIYQWRRNQQRIEQLRQFCLGKGWQFVPSDDEYTARWNCPPFFEGRSRHARDVVTGTLGQGSSARPFVAFDYSYVTDRNNGKSSTSQTHRFAICAVQLPTYLPALCITPENVLTRLGDVITGDDIELESEDFNRRFRVQCPDAKFACDVLSPRTMQLLLARTPL